ncbi:DNA topoisomerase VI subunit B, partial [mine drainage metagenome]
MAPPSIAQQLAAKQREISVAEFFERNRQILGFDNPQRSLLTTVKEAVDNSLDSCEEAGILPEVTVQIAKEGEDRLRVTIE